MPLTLSPVCQAERLSLSGPLITFLFSYLLLQRTDEDVNVAVSNYISYESFATVGEIRVYRRADFQSGSRVLKKVF